MKAIVIVANGLRLSYLGCYGNEWMATPSFDRLAAEGIVFDQHYADVPTAAGTRWAWRTGCHAYPPMDDPASLALSSDRDLVGLLSQSGITTMLVREPASTPGAFIAGWDHVQSVSPGRRGARLERTLEAILEGVERLAGQDNWLLWVDTNLLLPPWEIPADFLDRYREPDDDEAPLLEPLPDPVSGLLAPDDTTSYVRLQRTYGAAVTWLDAGLGLLLDELAGTAQFDDLILVLTSDRGLPLGEHGLVGEVQPWLHDERIHLPLIICLPGQEHAGWRVPQLTQPIDLMPTLLDLFGLPRPVVHGHSLVPLLREGNVPIRAYACAGLEVGSTREYALRTPAWGLVVPGTPSHEGTHRGVQLYAKPEDTWEVNNVTQHHLELVENLENVLHAYVQAARQPGPLKPPELRDVEAEQGEAGESSEPTAS